MLQRKCNLVNDFETYNKYQLTYVTSNTPGLRIAAKLISSVPCMHI